MHKKLISSAKLLPPEDLPAPERFPNNKRIPFHVHLDSLTAYLMVKENFSDDISDLKNILQMNQIILEFGCGNGTIAREIARKNPAIGVIATDLYDWAVPARYGSNYQKTAIAWKERQLETQNDYPDNLVLLRADAGILRHLPENCVDTILLVNPEPKAGQVFMEAMNDPDVYRKIKPGAKQIVILPFSREMGVASCGGYEFDHCEDWSRGLGFMMASGFDFRREEAVQWYVDLAKSSLYSSNSTQKDIFVFGYRAQPIDTDQKISGLISKLKGFSRSIKRLLKY